MNYTKSWLRPAEAEPGTHFQTWQSPDDPPSHSLPPAVAGKVAETFGPEAFGRFHRRLLEAYFSENRTVSDNNVLVEVATEAGIDRDDFLHRASTNAQGFTDAVVADHNLAYESGITAVPAVVINNEHLLTGALETAQYRKVVEAARTITGTSGNREEPQADTAEDA